jgi:hypothetical protein
MLYYYFLHRTSPFLDGLVLENEHLAICPAEPCNEAIVSQQAIPPGPTNCGYGFPYEDIDSKCERGTGI